MSYSESPYCMTIDLQILNHLGINLYSNAAAVLSEAVANAWDADAQNVSIDIQNEYILICDDGKGMSQDDINSRFLKVGYSKRENEGDKTSKGRNTMGRKGIGKLSLFSIADIVDVYSFKDGQKNCFRMSIDEIKEVIKQKKDYHPGTISLDPMVKDGVGTTLILRNLKRKRTDRTASALKKRLARRFSVIGLRRTLENGEEDAFSVFVNDEQVTNADREDLKRLEFIWEFGGKEVLQKEDLPNLKKRDFLEDVVSDNQEWRVKGWLGAVAEPKQLNSKTVGNLNNVIVISRGRLIQENILDKISDGRIFTKYLTGQIEADFLDQSNSDDIATSDRQRIIEDDDRYRELLNFIRRAVTQIGNKWTDWRNDARVADAVKEYPKIDEWLSNLPNMQKRPAQKMIGMIRGLHIDDGNQRRDLFRSSIVAFERLRLRDAAHMLTEITAEKLLPLLADLSTLEGSLYRDIISSRVEVIQKFENLVDADEKEKILQKHLFENLWLLDPGWERAAGSERMEKTLKKDYPEFSDNLSEKEKKGRYDIKYRTNVGQHILVELKRAGRKLSLNDLRIQGEKYFSALTKCLRKMGEMQPQISIVFVLGDTVKELDDGVFDSKYVEDSLKPLNARIVYYNELITNALNRYKDYLDSQKKVNAIDQLLQGI